MRPFNAATVTAILALAFAFGPGAQAQSYPDRPIRIVVPYPAGGGIDLIARAIGNQLTQRWGQPVIAENRPGSGTIVAAEGAAFMSGLGDLEPVRLSFRNANLKLDQAMVAEASLLRRKPCVHCPLIVAYGEGETDDYKRQCREVAAYWAGHGNAVEVFELKHRNHFDAVLEWADPESGLFRANRAMMGL